MTATSGDGALPHLDERGEARMVDVTAKQVTVRTARAAGFLRVGPNVIAMLREGSVPKGDALAVARIAGICGAKRVPDLIPLAHPIALHGVDVDLTVLDTGVRIEVTTRTADRTGVEMEALTGVAVAGLALHDMLKKADPAAVLGDIRLIEKTGGRSGHWRREGEPA